MIGFGSSNDDPPLPPRPTAKSLPIQGMILRSKSGNVVPFLLPPPIREKNLSQKALRQLLVGMLLTVFVGYCMLMFFLIQQHHLQQQSILDGKSIGSGNSWGPTGHSMATAQEILRDHMQYMSNQRQKELLTPEVPVQQNVHVDPEGGMTTSKAKKVVKEPRAQDGVTAFERLESVPEKSKHKGEGDNPHDAEMLERTDGLKQVVL